MSMLKSVLHVIALITFAWPAAADDVRVEIADLYDALSMSEIIGVMRQEGMAHGSEIEADLFPGRGGDAWRALLDRIYDQGRMEEAVISRFGSELSDVDIHPLLGFFDGELGQRIIEFEVGARMALMDEQVEEASKAALHAMRNDNSAKYELLVDFVEANDLVESNVMGAMNSNYAFYVGLMDGNAFPRELTEADILDDVWAQEEEIRADTEEWLYTYLGLAYQPLSDEDLEAYIALSRSAEGRALNRALFAAFDQMYNAISHDLGVGAAGFMAGQDI